MRRFALIAAALAALSAGGCASRAATTPTPEPRAGRPAASGPTTDDLVPASPASGERVVDIELVRPASIACSLKTAGWSGVMELRAGGPTLATTRGAPATLHLGDEGDNFVDVDAGFSLGAVVTSPSVFLAQPIALGDFAVPLAGTALELRAPHTTGTLNIGLDVSDLFEAPRSITQTLRCRDLTPTPTEYDAHRFVRTPQSIEVGLQTGTEIRSGPRGAPVARVGRSTQLARFGALEEGARRVVIEGRGYLATGWVPAEAVQIPYYGFGRGFGRMGAHVRRRLHPARCATSVPIYGQVGNERAVVGRMLPGSPFHRSSVDGSQAPRGFVAIEPSSSSVVLAPGAMLLLREDDLERCLPAR